MPGLVFGGLALILGLLLMRSFTRANPKMLARRLKAAGGIAALGLGGLLTLTGKPFIGIPLLGVGLGLLGAGMDLAGPAKPKRSTSASITRTAFLEMRLDHASGTISGSVLAGSYAGRRLDQLGAADLQRLTLEVDEESLSLLEAYLQRRGAGGSAHAQRDADGRGAQGVSGEMSQDEAYQVLGLQPGAGADEIRRAHRALMMKLHPDQGGSTYLAARVNEAKEVLLRRHG